LLAHDSWQLSRVQEADASMLLISPQIEIF